jgi:hypothetical protein
MRSPKGGGELKIKHKILVGLWNLFEKEIVLHYGFFLS